MDDPLHEPRTISDDESANNTATPTERLDTEQDQEMITITSHPAWDDQDDDRLPPLWRQMSDQPFVEGEDAEDGPSDYWRRPGSDAEHWQDQDDGDRGDGGDGLDLRDGETDAAEYEKRLEQVLALQPETPSPTKRRGFHMQQFDDEDDEWSDYHPINGRGYDEAVRDVLGEGTEKGDEEFDVQVSPTIHAVLTCSPTTHRRL